MKNSLAIVSSIATFGLFLGHCQANTTDFSFTCITNNNPAGVAAASQFTGVLSQYSSNRVLFTITNSTAGVVSSITDIYFDDSARKLSNMSIIGNTYGVAFRSDASPSNLPGASNADPDFVTRYSADSDWPTISNGLNPGESISFKFSGLYDDVVQCLSTGEIRIGIQVQGFSCGYAESYVSFVPAAAPPGVPAPGALLLAGFGLGVVRWFRTRRSF